MRAYVVAGRRYLYGSLAVLASTLVACQQSPLPVQAQTAAETVLPYNKVYGIATHNSYWMNRSDKYDLYASGTQELISDQLLHEHVRGIELDVHSEGAPDHEWKVYHTSDSEDTTCRYLSDCLEYLRNFQYAVPDHEVVNVIVELKNVDSDLGVVAYNYQTSRNFNATHTMSDFDNIFRNALGSALYTPSDYYRDMRCSTSQSITSCAEHGWPTIEQLRGKFIINLMGNWGTAMADWTDYAADVDPLTVDTPSVSFQPFFDAGRVAFPIASVFDVQLPETCPATDNGGDGDASKPHPVTLDGHTVCITDVAGQVNSVNVAFRARQWAYDMSAFWQFEPVQSPTAPSDSLATSEVKRFLGRNGIVRGHDSFEYQPYCANDSAPENCQEKRVSDGYQLVQTDYPWFFVNNNAMDSLGIPTDPAQRLKDPAGVTGVGTPVPIMEPGNRLYFQSSIAATYPGMSRRMEVPDTGDHWWEATVSSTRNGSTVGEWTDVLTLYDVEHDCPGYPKPENDPSWRDGTGCTSYPHVLWEQGEGCIELVSATGKYREEICRQKNNPGGDSYYQEAVDLYVRNYKDGALLRSVQYRAPRYAPCKSSLDPNSDDVYDGCIGSMIAIGVRNSGSSSVVSIYSASKMQPSTGTSDPLTPQWTRLTVGHFDEAMTSQGFRGWKSALLVGPRMADALITVGTDDFRPDPSRLHAVSLQDLPTVEGGDNGLVRERSFRAVLPANTSTSISPTPDSYGWIGKAALAAANTDHATVSLLAPSPLVPGGAAFSELDYAEAGAQSTGPTVSTANPTTLAISAEGVTTIDYHAVDLDGNPQADATLAVRIDVTPPIISQNVVPAPNAAGWNRTPVTVSFTCSDVPSGVLSCSQPVSLATEGRAQAVSGSAQDFALNGASTAAPVSIDWTPPVVAYTNNAGTYTVDQTVDIQCSATDALSGIASSSCVPLVGPAYDFTVGSNSYSFTATDRADNSASAQTSFTVQVTFDSLCALVHRFSTSAATAGSLCGKLSSARNAPSSAVRDHRLVAFENQLAGKTDQEISDADAAILQRLVQYLF